MFSPDIVESDAFLDMPVSSQALYFHLGMDADDDGFVNPKRIMRLVGASEDDLKILTAKRFILSFDGGVVVVKHWLIHNLIRADLYKETFYKKEKSLLGLNEYGAYTELRDGVSEIKKIEAPKWLVKRRGDLRTANVPQTVHRLGKVRLGNNTFASDKPAREGSQGKKKKKFDIGTFPREEYVKVTEAYKRIKQVSPAGDEWLPIAREIKLIFKATRTAEEIIKTMEICETNYDDWSMNTVRMKIADVVSGNLIAKSNVRGEPQGIIAKGARSI